VRRQGSMTADYADADILAAGDMEIQGRLVPLIRQVHSEYFVTEQNADAYNGRVALPPRSIAGTVRHVQLIVGGVTRTLPMVALEDDYLGVGGSLPMGWYFDGGGIVLLPRGASGTVRIRFYMRPSKMVLESDTSKVWPITVATQSGGGYALTVTGTLPSAKVDIINPGASHELDAFDVLAAGTSNLTVTQAAMLNQVAVGGYVVAAGYSPFVPLPEELSAALVHQTAHVLLRALGYDSEAGAQARLADAALTEGKGLLVPRSEGNPKRMRGGIRRSLQGFRR